MYSCRNLGEPLAQEDVISETPHTSAISISLDNFFSCARLLFDHPRFHEKVLMNAKRRKGWRDVNPPGARMREMMRHTFMVVFNSRVYRLGDELERMEVV